MKPRAAGRGGAPVTDEGVLQAMTSTEAAPGEVTLDGPPPGRAPAAAFAGAAESGRLDLPLPGSGRTRERWARLAGLAAQDLSLARLGEGHADAVAILAELGGPAPEPGSRWGVWAAMPPGPGGSAGSSSTALAPAPAPAHSSPRPRRTGPGCSRWPPPALTRCRAAGRLPGWRAATPSTSSSATSLPSRWGRPAATPGAPGSPTAAWAWRRAGTAGPGPSRAPCWPRPAAGTWARTPWPTWAR